MSAEYLSVLNGVRIMTTVTRIERDVDNHLESFLRSVESYGDDMKVIGFDIEWEFKYSDETRCATLHLCNGRSCLVIQLRRLFSAPVSLLNFLRRPDFIFVSVGIKENMAKLEKDHGIICRNAVELGPLAARLLRSPRLSFCDLDELALQVCDLDLRDHRPIKAFNEDWGKYTLSMEQAQLAAVNVFSYHEIGTKLLRGD